MKKIIPLLFSIFLMTGTTIITTSQITPLAEFTDITFKYSVINNKDIIISEFWAIR